MWGQLVLCSGSCPVPWKTFSCVPGLYAMDAGGTPCPPVVTTRNVSAHCQTSSGGEAPSGLFQNHCLTHCTWRQRPQQRPEFLCMFRVLEKPFEKTLKWCWSLSPRAWRPGESCWLCPGVCRRRGVFILSSSIVQREWSPDGRQPPEIPMREHVCREVLIVPVAMDCWDLEGWRGW